MPTLDIEITCLKTRCAGCYHCHYGEKRTLVPDITCTLFGRALRSPDGSPMRLTQCMEAEERHNTTARVLQTLATNEGGKKRCRRFIDMRGATSRPGTKS